MCSTLKSGAVVAQLGGFGSRRDSPPAVSLGGGSMEDVKTDCLQVVRVVKVSWEINRRSDFHSQGERQTLFPTMVCVFISVCLGL